MLKIVTTVARALEIYGTLAFAEMIKNCMSQELSWKVGINLIISVGTCGLWFSSMSDSNCSLIYAGTCQEMGDITIELRSCW